MEIKHIYWFAYFNLDEPSVRYRAKFPLQQLKEKQGITFSIVYPGYDVHSLIHFVVTYFSALLFRKRNSIIVFQKIYTKGIYTTAMKLLLYFRPQFTLYDIDDAEYTRRPAETIHHFMRRCSACLAGSTSLVDYIQPFNQHVFLLTSPVIDHGYTKTHFEKTMTVGWIGYYGAHRQSLTELFFPSLHRIDFPLKLILLGVANRVEEQEIKLYFKNNKYISVETPLGLDWHDEDSIYQWITTFDIGVSPLIDTEFNRGKSAFKLKQCLSCGVPVLGSSVGENKVFLKDGVNGYLCETPEDYFEKITLIYQTKSSHYSALSNNAKATFATFSVDHYCSTLLNYFK
jgi:glycosyltransferase involved in cell wall biosynthesis